MIYDVQVFFGAYYCNLIKCKFKGQNAHFIYNKKK